MSSFTKASWVRAPYTEDGRSVFRILAPGFDYDIGYLGSGLALHVNAGNLTDFVSIPLWIIWLIRLLRLEWILKSMVKSAAGHDQLRADLRFTKLTGDVLFLTMMETEGTPVAIRWIAFLLVLLNNDRSTVLVPTEGCAKANVVPAAPGQ